MTFHREVPPPSWETLQGQPSCKYASVAYARWLCQSPWLKALFEEMLLLNPQANLADVRFWEHLPLGWYPGLRSLHYDCFNSRDDPRSSLERHVLYFVGAGCCPVFPASAVQPSEGVIVSYGHKAQHQITAAKAAGPRLLVRLTYQPNINPRNTITLPPMFPP